MSPAAAVPASRMQIRMYLTIASSDGLYKNRVRKRSGHNTGFKKVEDVSESSSYIDEVRAIEAHLGETIEELLSTTEPGRKSPTNYKE